MDSGKPVSSSASRLKIVILIVVLTGAAAGALYLGNKGIWTDAWKQVQQRMVDRDISQNKTRPATDAHPRVSINTQIGAVLIELYPEQAPKTVAELVSLIKSGYYDSDTIMETRPELGLVIAKIGGSAKSFEFTDDTNALTSHRGSVAISKSSTSHAYLNNIFIGYNSQPELEKHYTIIGQVVEGIDDAERSKPGILYKVSSLKLLNGANTNTPATSNAGG